MRTWRYMVEAYNKRERKREKEREREKEKRF
jgi:hypothetical protein